MLNPWLNDASVPSQPQPYKAGVDSGDPGSGADDGASRRAYYYDFSIAPEQTLGGAGTLLRRMRERQQQLTSSILGSGSNDATGQGQGSAGPGHSGSGDTLETSGAGSRPGAGSREVGSGPGGEADTQTTRGWGQPGDPVDQTSHTRSWQPVKPQQQQQQQQNYAQQGGAGLEVAQARVSDIVEWHHRRMAAALAQQPGSPGSGGSREHPGSKGSSMAHTPRSGAGDRPGNGNHQYVPQRQSHSPYSGGGGGSRSETGSPVSPPYTGFGLQPLSPRQQAGLRAVLLHPDTPAAAISQDAAVSDSSHTSIVKTPILLQSIQRHAGSPAHDSE